MQRPRVVRARARFGMELQRARAQLREVEPLDRAVVERDVRRLLASVARTAKPWFCARDEHAAVARSSTGWFAPRWPNGSLNVSCPVAHREQLVAEADAEHGRAAEQLAHDRDLAAASGSGSPGPGESSTPS